MIRHMEKANTSILMELSIKASGRKTNNMDMVKRHGQMVHATKVSTKKEERTATESSFGQMDLHMKEIS